MKIRIATRAWSGSSGVDRRSDTEVGVSIPWVELDGYRTADAIDAVVESGEGMTTVTLTIAAAAEMVLVDGKGEILPPEPVTVRDIIAEATA